MHCDLYMCCGGNGKALVSAWIYNLVLGLNMDSWTFNKIAGAVLGSALLVLGLQNLSGILFAPHAPSHEKPGFLIETAEAVESGGEAAAAVSVGTLLASADATKGADVAKACAACHDFTKGGANKTGPALYDVVERPVAAHEGFAYSEGAKAKAAEKWTYDNLNAFLKAPKGFMPGTKMAFGGIGNDKKRADLLAYLASLSDAPKPFPAP
jgi:cytochrome c